MSLKLLSCLLLSCFTLGLSAGSASAQINCPCVEPNAAGTVVLMPTNCGEPYLGFMQISDGIPGGTIDCNAELHTFLNNNEVPGGALGGHTQTWDATLKLTMTGTGSLAGFNRIISVPVSATTESSPKSPGDAVQALTHQIATLSGELFGDPDFCTFRVKAGSAVPFAPSSGQTTLSRIGGPGTDFEVESFFDIHYTIEFQGCPGSILEGMNGTTENTHRFQLCEAPVPVEESTWGAIKALYQ